MPHGTSGVNTELLYINEGADAAVMMKTKIGSHRWTT